MTSRPPSVLARLPEWDRRIQSRFTSRLHHTRTAAWLGLSLGASFTVCFLTGLMSLWAQAKAPWIDWPSRPAGLYRISQGVHVVTGFASIPLLLAKLWTVSPQLVRLPPARSVAHAIERLALLPLVGGSLFLLFSGTANVARWYPWGFYFPLAHRAAAFIAIGGLVVHVGCVFVRTRDALRRAPSMDDDPRALPADTRVAVAVAAAVDAAPAGRELAAARAAAVAATEAGQPVPVDDDGFPIAEGDDAAAPTAPTVDDGDDGDDGGAGRDDPADPTPALVPSGRRSFLAGVAGTVGVVVVATAGGTVAPLSRFSVFAQRQRGSGPQGLPVNKSAAQARVEGTIDAATYRLEVVGAVEDELSLSLDELRALPARRAELAIACVEGWSASAPWSGVPVRDLLERAGARPGATVQVESLQEGGLYSISLLNAGQAADRDTLLALDLRGEPLHIDHGWPVRLIGPNRPGVSQTKWVRRLVVS